MFSPEMMGQAPPAAPQEGGDPMAALAGLMGGGGAPPPMPGPGEGEPAGESTLDVLNRMIADAKLYIELDDDEEDKLTMTKVLQMLQKYLADEQREQQDAMGGKLSPRLMARAYGGQ